jgi:3',5'-cyclic AMP phosphodiesterase CpdA
LRLLALSDVHVNHGSNLDALAAIGPHPEDWLIVAGDVCERPSELEATLDLLGERFAKLLWVPGNHELWAVGKDAPRGVARYMDLVRICRERGVLTPEDPYIAWPGQHDLVLVPMFLLYDYTFSPDGMDPDAARAWAREAGIRCMDEVMLRPDPYPTIDAWCRARVEATERRLDALPAGTRTVLINHWPLRRDLVRLYRIPRFSPWCGTRATEDWHVRYRADVVVTGHLHMRATDWRNGTRFEEVSLGYPRHWTQERGAASYLRTVLPGPPPPPSGFGGPNWHR